MVHHCVLCVRFFFRIRRSPTSTRTYSLFPYTTFSRSSAARATWIREPPRPRSSSRRCATRSVPRHDRDRRRVAQRCAGGGDRKEHTSELQSLMRISYAVFCLKKKKKNINDTHSLPIIPRAKYVSI